jgi:hypothetical protein
MSTARSREPLKAINANTTPQRIAREAGKDSGISSGVAKRLHVTPAAAVKTPVRGVMSGGAKRVGTKADGGADVVSHTSVTPKKTPSSHTKDSATKETHKETHKDAHTPHTPGYLQGTQSIKAVPLGASPARAKPHTTPGKSPLSTRKSALVPAGYKEKSPPVAAVSIA